jgi:hypothetical protein
MVFSGAFRVLQEGRKSCLPNIGVVAPYYWGNPKKGSKGRIYTCPQCGEEEENLEHIMKMCPELKSPKRRNFVQVPPPLLFMTTD